ncbi:M14 family metallopeptidase [Pedobacter sp. PLR]|uniref:M14 metallopeptidase family protein n=1 Tax=Pedobacter sp. PLR TaxID=2994465 RepID=UPI0022455CB1|nr:M14 metallopeptidase family protein [Pedobacter sp. PLR]MCX2453012.1 M14 family metallopeptidase [Pedobacter sp. PLR]
MKYYLLSFLLLLIGLKPAEAQLRSPEEFLGYPLGSKFTPHYKVLEYFKYLGSTNKNIKIQKYGKTYEGRELLVAMISAKDNMDNLEGIRKQNLSLSNAEKNNGNTEKPFIKGKQPAILWLSYNVHGNEASSTETALKMLFTLAEAKSVNVQNWLKNTVVIIDPCLNPDGRERYLNFFGSVTGIQPNPNPMAREHIEPWPGGRSNHYYFDLNRDWAWQSQVETQQRLDLYQDWMPEVHVDFHEQSYNDPYYFAPAAEPIHQDITPWQRNFQITVGKNNAKYFDQNGWQYFTKEQFDLLYPSYGDTYPLYNGAIGMTYEQGGIGAGLMVTTIDGDTLTLKDRIAHHFTTGMATLETVSNHADQLVEEFGKYFEKGLTNPPGAYKSFVIKAQNPYRLEKLAGLLKKNHIQFAYGLDKELTGYSYENRKSERFKVERNDLVINLNQPRAVLANVLMEPQTTVSDSNTYDITAWALPYAYGLPAFAIVETIKGRFAEPEENREAFPVVQKPYAWIFPWSGLPDAQLLMELQKENIKVRIAEEPFTIAGRKFGLGSLLVYRTENERFIPTLTGKIAAIEKKTKKSFYPAASGFVDRGKDFGSSSYRILKVPKVAIVAGPESSAYSVGEVWHFLEQELNYPVNLIALRNIENINLDKINVLILPDGNYPVETMDKLEDWIKIGGKVILLEDAIQSVTDSRLFEVKKKEELKEEEILINPALYANRNSIDMSDAIPGAIFKVHLDAGHPLSTGLGTYYYALKTDDHIYAPLNRGWNVGMLKSDSYVAGVAGKKVLKTLSSGMTLGVQSLGKGTIIYIGTNVLFRSFWENGKQLFLNALFLVD